MDAKSLIDSYVDDVARRLPRKIRNEVGLELRALLTDELASAAAETGRDADAATALRVLANLGRPEHVAARYGGQRGFNIIEPEHAPAFVKLATLGVVVQWVFSLPGVFVASSTFGGWWLESGFAALWWVGLLVVWFGIGSWVQRRTPVEPHSFERPWIHYLFWLPVRQDWQPAQLEHPYSAAKTLIPLATSLTIVFVSPEWFFGLFDPEADLSWLRYDGDFRQRLLPLLLVLMVMRIALFTAATVSRGWRAHGRGTFRSLDDVRRIAHLVGDRLGHLCVDHSRLLVQGLVVDLPVHQLPPDLGMDPECLHPRSRSEGARALARKCKETEL